MRGDEVTGPKCYITQVLLLLEARRASDPLGLEFQVSYLQVLRNEPRSRVKPASALNC